MFIDSEGLPANGDLSVELKKAISVSAYLIIVVGQSYPNSKWCGRELEWFVQECGQPRQQLLERVFVVVLDRDVEGVSWGPHLDRPIRPILQKFYDPESGEHFAANLEDKYGKVIPGPRFIKGVREIAKTMAERLRVVNESLEPVTDIRSTTRSSEGR